MSHMRGVRLCAVVASCALCLTACAEFYPRFDSLLNPDIRELRSVEVVDGVRCAVASFLLERFDEGHKAALAKAANARCQVTDAAWRFKAMKLDQTPNSLTEGQCILSDDPKDADPVNCNPAYHAWSYERYQKRDNISNKSPADIATIELKTRPSGRRDCAPNGGCPPGTVPKGNGACSLEDGSRFALDPNSSATIELSLTASNTGSMAYTRLDPEQMGWLQRVVASGNNPPGTPFPSLTLKSKAQNIVNMQIVMPQSPWIAESKPSKGVRDSIEAAKEAIKKKTLQEQRTQRQKIILRNLFAESEIPEVPAVERPAYTPQALKALQNEQNKGYEENCTTRRQTDFVGLKHLLKKFVAEREDALFEGAPDVSLDQMVLTTSFQLILDASAGTYHIFRFFPVLVPPTLNLNPDHTHQLKITFKGVKGRANPRNREALRQKCLTRLQGVVGATQECNTPNSLLLESLIEAVESTKSGG
jgi:hypothetical protein